MKERIKGAFKKKKIFHFLKMVLFVVALSLILLSLLGTVAHATGLVDDTINAENLYSKYSLSNYQLDFYVDNSWSWLPWNWLDGIGKSVQYGLYCITNFVWTISLYLSNAKLSDVLEDDTEQKVILTPEQEERLLAFMEKDKIYSKYYDEVVLLLETGLRISEFCGLTTHIDMQNRILNIDHQLLKDSEMGYYIETPKTKNGKRELPLTERAYQAIQRILKNRGKAQPLIVGGYSNFLFLNREGLPKVAGNYEGMVRGLIKKYNKYHTDKLPNITPHSFRHTYCTNMANRGMNPNTLQYLMGHANITMTLGYYAHGTFQSAKAELERLAC